jgi:hypothetical protein
MRSCLVTRSSLGSSAFSGIFAAAALGLRDNRPRRVLGDDLSGRGLASPRRRGFGASLFGCGALEVLGLFNGKGWHGLGFPWFAAPKLTLARPKAPQSAGRALNLPSGGQVHRPTAIAMRTMRRNSTRNQRSSRFKGLSIKESQPVSCTRPRHAGRPQNDLSAPCGMPSAPIGKLSGLAFFA